MNRAASSGRVGWHRIERIGQLLLEIDCGLRCPRCLRRAPCGRDHRVRWVNWAQVLFSKWEW
jgi:hypothetical protein